MAITLDIVQMLGVSMMVLLFGQLLVNKIGFLRKYCLPAPVVGGFIFALIRLAGYVTGTFTLEMDETLKTLFMICFFTTVGFGASFDVLKKGGIAVLIFLVVASVLAALQNVLGVALAKAFGLNPLFGLCVGSVPMTGGHATAMAYGPEIEALGVAGAKTVSVAAATFGLIAGSMLGGPVANFLITKNNLKPTDTDVKNLDILEEKSTILDNKNLMSGFIQISIAVGIGSVISFYISKKITAPAYIGSMFVAIIMRNMPNDIFKIKTAEIDSLGEIFLNVFLAQALMTLKLWDLAELATQMIVMLLAQVALITIYVIFVTYRATGKDYDAAVITAGHCGFGLGATPNAVANMNAVVKKFYPSPKAFFVIPIVGGMFIDIVNMALISSFITIFK